MKSIFDNVSKNCSKLVTNAYSTSFSISTKMLSDCIRQDIYNIYGFVRLADEIVDTFHNYDKEKLFRNFEKEFQNSSVLFWKKMERVKDVINHCVSCFWKIKTN